MSVVIYLIVGAFSFLFALFSVITLQKNQND